MLVVSFFSVRVEKYIYTQVNLYLDNPSIIDPTTNLFFSSFMVHIVAFD